MQKRFNWAGKARKGNPLILINLFLGVLSAFARKHSSYEFIKVGILKKGKKTAPDLWMIHKIILVLVIIIMSTFNTPTVFSQAIPEKTDIKDVSPGNLGIEVRNGRIFMDVEDVELAHVLRIIANETNIDITIGWGVGGRISARMNGLTVEDALKRLCKNRALVFEYLPESRKYRVIRAGAYAGSANKEVKGERPGSIPPDTRQEKGSIKLSKSADNSDKQVKGLTAEELYDSRGRRLFKPGELLIRSKKGVTESQITRLHKSLGSEVIDRIDSFRLQKVKLRDGLAVQDAITLYSSSNFVEIAEKHALRYPNATIPDDPYFEDQWGLTRIMAPAAWDINQGDPGIIVAVIDTGVDYSHPDLADNIWMNTAEINGLIEVDDDGNGYIDDFYGWDFAGEDQNDPFDEDSDPVDMDGHGTHVAGIIAAKGNNGQGVAGVSWNSKLMVLKVQADNGTHMESWDIIKAIDYAVDNGAKIVNCSFGGEEDILAEEIAFDRLKEGGILAVCAAGNDSSNTDIEENYPSAYTLDNIISVAAGDREDELAGFSNYGPTSVDIMAPGDDIKSTVPAGTYTEAFVALEINSTTTNYSASGMTFAGTTDQSGISRLLYDCGRGYPEEFPTGVYGNIALIERGNSEGNPDFYFYQKIENAMNAGAVAAIIYNDAYGSFSGTLIGPGDWIPVVSISKDDGEALMGLASQHPTITLYNRMNDTVSYYTYKDGTSMAAPYVSGIAALILARDPSLDYLSVKNIILDTVDKYDSLFDKMVTGGRVNALSALCSMNIVPGDLSCDDAIGLDDALLALQLLSGLEPSVCPCIPGGIDINGDARIGIEDAIYILQKISE